MNIGSELVREIADVLEVTGVRLTPIQVRQLLEGEGSLVGQLEDWGAKDTELLGQLANLLSMHLLGERWPTYGDAKDRDAEAFTARLFEAARKKGFEVIGQ